MHDDIIEAPPGDIPVDLAIWLSPLQTWRSVYGNGFCDEAMRAVSYTHLRAHET